MGGKTWRPQRVAGAVCGIQPRLQKRLCKRSPRFLLPPPQEDAANAFIQEHLVPQLVAANVTTVVDILRKPTADSHPGEARPRSAR